MFIFIHTRLCFNLSSFGLIISIAHLATVLPPADKLASSVTAARTKPYQTSDGYGECKGGSKPGSRYQFGVDPGALLTDLQGWIGI